MDLGLAVLALGLAIVVLGGILAWRAQTRGNAVSAGVSVAELFSVELRLSASDKAEAQQAVRAADEARGIAEPDQRELLEGQSTALARILWVDDAPANNRHESVALEKLGKLIATATDSASAYFYVEHIDFDLVITDMTRDRNPNAGVEMIKKLRDDGFEKPIVVYTSDAAGWDRTARDAGADSVVDRPAELVRTVIAHLSAQ